MTVVKMEFTVFLFLALRLGRGLGTRGLMAAQLGFDQLARETWQVVDAVAAGIAVNGLHDSPGK